MVQENKDRLQTQTPALRDLVVKAAYARRRAFPADVFMVDMGNFSGEADSLRIKAEESSFDLSSLLVVDHKTNKLRMYEPRPIVNSQIEMNAHIEVDKSYSGPERRLRQDKSVGLLIATARNDKEALPYITGLLLGDTNIWAPAGVMIVAPHGVNLFFRSGATVEQTTKESKESVDKTKSARTADLAKWARLMHFYCPKGATIATPAI